MHVKEKEYLGNKVSVELLEIKRDSTKIYCVKLLSGRWPLHYDLVTICDGGDPDLPWAEQRHRGGTVSVQPDGSRLVEVKS